MSQNSIRRLVVAAAKLGWALQRQPFREVRQRALALIGDDKQVAKWINRADEVDCVDSKHEHQ